MELDIQYTSIAIVSLLFFIYLIKKKVAGHIGISNKVESSFSKLLDNKSVMTELSSILRKEGDLVVLLKKISLWRNNLPNRDINWLELIALNSESKKDYDFQTDALRISQTLLASEAYKFFSESMKFSERDDEVMELIIYWMILSDNFKYTAINVLLGRNVEDFPGYKIDYRRTCVTIADLVDLADRNSVAAKKEKLNNL
jgi:hypothetical protein